MTRSRKTPLSAPSPAAQSWSLQDAKARFSELVRRERSVAHQDVTVPGREEFVGIGADASRRLKADRLGESIVAAMQASPCRDIELEPRRAWMPVRDVEL
jgi:hypothetical protein